MNMKKKLIAAILSLSLAVAPFSGVQAKEAKVAEKALHIDNLPYSLPENQEGSFCVDSNFTEFSPSA